MERKIVFPYDLKGRKAIYFVQEAQENFKNAVFFEKNNHRINVKSLLGVLSLGIVEGDEVEILCVDENEYEILMNVLDSIDSEVL